MKKIIKLLYLLSFAFSTYVYSQSNIIIDGQTGIISGTSKRIFFPGDVVIFEINNSNLLKFAYELKIDKEIFLVKNYNIIGNEPNITAINSNPGTIVSEKFSEGRTDVDTTLVDDFDNILKMYNNLESKLITNVKNYDDLYNEVNIHSIDSNLNWNIKYFEEATILSKELDENTKEIFNLKSYIINFYYLYAQAKLKGNIPKDHNLDFTDIKNNLENYTALVMRIQSILNRWSTIRSTNPQPKITQKLTIGDVAKQYIVSLSWSLVNEPKVTSFVRQLIIQKPEDSKPQTLTEPVRKITILLEGHVKSHFNFNIGIGGFCLPNNQSFGFALNKQSSNNTIPDTSYSISKSTSDVFIPKFYLSLGWYFLGGVDDLDTKANYINPMLIIGCNIAATPSNFMIGLGLDFKDGFNINFGITPYTATFLEAGWSEDDTISPLLKSLSGSTPPVYKVTKIGYFIALGFRPKIFSLFDKILK